jgi:hypothetical protein
MISGSRRKWWNTVRTALMLISCAMFVGELGFSPLGSAGVFVLCMALSLHCMNFRTN